MKHKEGHQAGTFRPAQESAGAADSKWSRNAPAASLCWMAQQPHGNAPAGSGTAKPGSSSVNQTQPVESQSFF